MRKHDMAVRELEVARNKLADVIAGKKSVEDFLRRTASKEENADADDKTGRPDEPSEAVLGNEDATSMAHPDSAEAANETNTRKRKRKEKKENKKKERIEQQLQKLTDENQNPGAVYDETLLAVVGILDTMKTESNVAAWIRSGGLIKSLIESGDNGMKREISVGSDGSTTSMEKMKSPKKKIKTSEHHVPPAGQEEGPGEEALNKEEILDSVVPDHLPPPTSSSPRDSSPPVEGDPDDLSETERTGVPLDDVQVVKDSESGTMSVEKQLWFDHPGTLKYWASRGREVLEGMGITVVADVVGPTG